MNMGKLLTVRLSDEDAASVEKLRRSGISVSQFVRDKLREAAAAARGKRPRNLRAIVEQIIAENPGSEPFPPVDATDRRAMQKYIRAKIEAKMKKAK
jgi:Arc/MetJ-type ribon-helix-helix transcriptional regulator